MDDLGKVLVNLRPTDYVELDTFSTLESLYENGIIDNSKICDIWNHLDFIDYDLNYVYEYPM